MRVIGYFFCFYILALSCMPCADRGEECRSNKACTEQAGDHKQSKEHDEACSPFCICACCGQQAPFNVFPATTRYLDLPRNEKKILLPDQRLVSNYYGNIWQPPKLS